MINNTNKAENCFTPATLGNRLFSIPLYQRLFEWSSDEIEILLKDLHDAFLRNREEAYYIGMLTAHKDSQKDDGRIDLVDGQQRFTVMTLMSIALGWDDFYYVNKVPRLSFFARENDEEFIRKWCDGISFSAEDYKNEKMDAGIKFIKNFFEQIPSMEEREGLKSFIKNKMTFFITMLPEKYSLADLNKYFESMNSAGRPLENYEILKVELLKKLKTDNADGLDKYGYTRLWNVIVDMDQPLLRKIKKGSSNEPIAKFRARYAKAINTAKTNPKLFMDLDMNNRLLNDVYKVDESAEGLDAIKSIGEIDAKNEKPKPREINFSEIGLFSFPLFLLLVLYQMLKNKELEIHVNEFFKVGNLISTFENYKEYFSVEDFLKNLVYYRLILDYYFIRQSEGSYSLENYVYDDDENSVETWDKNAKEKLVKFQSMLFVSSTPVTYYRWLNPAFDFINRCLEKSNDVDPVEFLVHLKNEDNKVHPKSSVSEEYLRYPGIDRYWFWRLDYFLWEGRDKYFKKPEDLAVVEHYDFRRNRSIEHIAPQTPQGESTLKWDESNQEYRDCFGNLAMISSGQNSSLLNKPYQEKQGHIRAFVENALTGTVESLKMLKMYEVKNWNVNTIKEHQEEMIGVLRDSYK